MMTMTMHQAGRPADRVRPVASLVCSSGRRTAAPAAPEYGTTGLPAHGYTAGATTEFGANATATGLTTQPWTIKHTTRPLGTRST